MDGQVMRQCAHMKGHHKARVSTNQMHENMGPHITIKSDVKCTFEVVMTSKVLDCLKTSFGFPFRYYTQSQGSDE